MISKSIEKIKKGYIDSDAKMYAEGVKELVDAGVVSKSDLPKFKNAYNIEDNAKTLTSILLPYKDVLKGEYKTAQTQKNVDMQGYADDTRGVVLYFDANGNLVPPANLVVGDTYYDAQGNKIISTGAQGDTLGFGMYRDIKQNKSDATNTNKLSKIEARQKIETQLQPFLASPIYNKKDGVFRHSINVNGETFYISNDLNQPQMNKLINPFGYKVDDTTVTRDTQKLLQAKKEAGLDVGASDYISPSVTNRQLVRGGEGTTMERLADLAVSTGDIASLPGRALRAGLIKGSDVATTLLNKDDDKKPLSSFGELLSENTVNPDGSLLGNIASGVLQSPLTLPSLAVPALSGLKMMPKPVQGVGQMLTQGTAGQKASLGALAGTVGAPLEMLYQDVSQVSDYTPEEYAMGTGMGAVGGAAVPFAVPAVVNTLKGATTMGAYGLGKSMEASGVSPRLTSALNKVTGVSDMPYKDAMGEIQNQFMRDIGVKVPNIQTYTPTGNAIKDKVMGYDPLVPNNDNYNIGVNKLKEYGINFGPNDEYLPASLKFGKNSVQAREERNLAGGKFGEREITKFERTHDEINNVINNKLGFDNSKTTTDLGTDIRSNVINTKNKVLGEETNTYRSLIEGTNAKWMTTLKDGLDIRNSNADLNRILYTKDKSPFINDIKGIINDINKNTPITSERKTAFNKVTNTLNNSLKAFDELDTKINEEAKKLLDDTFNTPINDPFYTNMQQNIGTYKPKLTQAERDILNKKISDLGYEKINLMNQWRQEIGEIVNDPVNKLVLQGKEVSALKDFSAKIKSNLDDIIKKVNPEMATDLENTNKGLSKMLRTIEPLEQSVGNPNFADERVYRNIFGSTDKIGNYRDLLINNGGAEGKSQYINTVKGWIDTDIISRNNDGYINTQTTLNNIKNKANVLKVATQNVPDLQKSLDDLIEIVKIGNELGGMFMPGSAGQVQMNQGTGIMQNIFNRAQAGYNNPKVTSPSAIKNVPMVSSQTAEYLDKKDSLSNLSNYAQ
jgi:hypothetical protein